MKKYTFFLLLILLTGCASSRKAHVSATPDGKQYVVILSMDAFRWDLAGRSHTPTLDSLARAGTYAEIYPVYPSNTFPSHYAMATGLHPDHHGVVNNNFYDRKIGRKLSVFDAEDVRLPGFWSGEPIWNTAERQGLTANIFMWPGSEVPIDGHQATGGDERRIDGREEIGCDHQLMVVDRRPARPVQVEERVVREVDDRTAVGRSLVCDDEAVVVGQLVGHRNLQVPGVSLIAVGREAGQYDLLRRHLDDIPHNHVEALGTAVQAVGAVVQRQRILLPVERKSPCGDTIAVTADGGAEEPLSGLIDVSAEIVVPQHDVREIAVAVGHPQFDDAAAEIGHRCLLYTSPSPRDTR